MNFFNAKLSGQGKATIVGTQTTISVRPENIRFSNKKIVENGASVLLGARPEQLEICREKTPEGIRGTVQIIQHLGQFVRYEVVLDSSISDASMEIDMPYMVEGVFERDSVYVKVKEGLPFMFLPEVRN
jgi:iron(III) transport system ATP-binding protein/putative spermidine/putrescine transport system ATP-binding protein